MSSAFNRKLSQLRDLVVSGLHLDNLDMLTHGCAELAQDQSCPLTLFVLKSVFRDISEAIERAQPLTEGELSELTEDVKRESLVILETLLKGSDAQSEDLERLVLSHLASLAVFKTK